MKNQRGILKHVSVEKKIVTLVVSLEQKRGLIEIKINKRDIAVPSKKHGLASLIRKEVNIWYRSDTLYEIETIPLEIGEAPFIVWQLSAKKAKVNMYQLPAKSRNMLVRNLCLAINQEITEAMPALAEVEMPGTITIPSAAVLLWGLDKGSAKLKILICDLRELAPGFFSNICFQVVGITEEELANCVSVSFEEGSKADDLIISFAKIECSFRAGRQK